MTDLSIEKYIDSLEGNDPSPNFPTSSARKRVHVFYGGADRFTQNVHQKLGQIALANLERNASNFVDFAKALWLPGADTLPDTTEQIQDLEFTIADAPERARSETPAAWLAWEVYRRTIQKLSTEPIEDYRIDFEDGYGFRADETEDLHCLTAARELAEMTSSESEIRKPRMGIRVKSFQPETRRRALRTLTLFLESLFETTGKDFPEGFVVTLPKVKSPRETEVLDRVLTDFETTAGLKPGTIGIEFLVETPEVLDVLNAVVESCQGRCQSAHFGAYDYTSSFGISSTHQHIRHASCDFARNEMQTSLAPLGIELVDSVTIEMPIPVHRDDSLSVSEIAENRIAIRNAWRKHFLNISHSQINGFYASWDLHPGQLVARYAAVTAFFLESYDEQAKRLRGFFEKATQAMTTGNIFDDAASAEGLMNYFRRGIASGAFELPEVTDALGITEDEFSEPSFSVLMEKRRNDVS